MANTNLHDRETYKHMAALCTCTNIRKTARIITQFYDDALQPTGLLATQVMLLVALAAYGPVPVTPFAEAMAMDPTALARNLKPLERDGFVEIAPGPDRRTRIVAITPQGQSVVEQAVPLWQAAQATVFEILGEDRFRMMLGNWAELASLTKR